jgi:hypothetical protein
MIGGNYPGVARKVATLCHPLGPRNQGAPVLTRERTTLVRQPIAHALSSVSLRSSAIFGEDSGQQAPSRQSLVDREREPNATSREADAIARRPPLPHPPPVFLIRPHRDERQASSRENFVRKNQEEKSR